MCEGFCGSIREMSGFLVQILMKQVFCREGSQFTFSLEFSLKRQVTVLFQYKIQNSQASSAAPSVNRAPRPIQAFAPKREWCELCRPLYGGNLHRAVFGLLTLLPEYILVN